MMSRNMAPLRLSMMLWLLALSLTFFSPETLADRIIGGHAVPSYSIPYQASITTWRRHYCGGTLIAPQWVVSAAHCWRPKRMMTVVLGKNNKWNEGPREQRFGVSKIFVHGPYFNYWTFHNDIMLIKLDREASAEFSPVALPPLDPPKLDGNTICTVSGWGVTRLWSYILSPELRAVNVKIMPSCGYYNPRKITDSMICAGSPWGGKDSCQGDSGSPLVCNNYFEGIVSWGIGCANRNFPGVYTRVRKFQKWINSTINNN